MRAGRRRADLARQGFSVFHIAPADLMAPAEDRAQLRDVGRVHSRVGRHRRTTREIPSRQELVRDS